MPNQSNYEQKLYRDIFLSSESRPLLNADKLAESRSLLYYGSRFAIPIVIAEIAILYLLSFLFPDIFWATPFIVLLLETPVLSVIGLLPFLKPAQKSVLFATRLMFVPVMGIAAEFLPKEIQYFITGVGLGIMSVAFGSPSIQPIESLSIALATPATLFLVSRLFPSLIPPTMPLFATCGFLLGFLRIPFWILALVSPSYIDDFGILPDFALPRKLKKQLAEKAGVLSGLLQRVARNPYNRWAITHILPPDISPAELLFSLLENPITYVAPTFLETPEIIEDERDRYYLVRKVLAELSGRTDKASLSERIAFAVTKYLRKPLPEHFVTLFGTAYERFCRIYYTGMPEDRIISLMRGVIDTTQNPRMRFC